MNKSLMVTIGIVLMFTGVLVAVWADSNDSMIYIENPEDGKEPYETPDHDASFIAAACVFTVGALMIPLAIVTGDD